MAIPFLFVSVASMVLLMIPTAISLQCYECNNLPQVLGGTSCNLDNVKKLICPPFYDRCMKMKYDMSIGIGAPQFVELRNCSVSAACDPQSDFNSCKMLSDGGLVSNCTMDCCQGELCNTGGSTSKPSTAGEGSTKKGIQSTASVVQSPTSKPSGAVLGPAVSLASILSAVVLPKIVGFN